MAFLEKTENSGLMKTTGIFQTEADETHNVTNVEDCLLVCQSIENCKGFEHYKGSLFPNRCDLYFF